MGARDVRGPRRGGPPPRVLSSSSRMRSRHLADADGCARPRGKLVGGVAIDDGDLDPASAPNQRDQRSGWVLSVGPADALDLCAGDLDYPFSAWEGGEPGCV